MVNAKSLLTHDFIVADVKDTVASLIGKMDRKKQSYAVVFDGKKYRGMASKKWLLSSRIDPSKMKIKNLISHRAKAKTQFFVPKLSPKTELDEICRLLCNADARALPVIVKQNAKENVIGVVRAVEVLKALRPHYKGVKAKELASTDLITANQKERVDAIIHKMSWEGIDRVIVINDAGKLIGIVTLVDLITDFHVFPRKSLRVPQAASHSEWRVRGFDVGEKHKLLKQPVHNIITHVPNCCTATPNTPVTSVIDDMLKHDVTSVVVVSREKPVGIITVKDILWDFVE